MSLAAAQQITPAGTLARSMHDLVRHGVQFGADRLPAPDQPWWRAMAATGTRSWLDTGDIDQADSIWCSSFSALTTNNSLLNKEVQKGTYDGLIREAAAELGGLPATERVLEIAFLLNARHALRLASRFGGSVSVELHTGLADDVKRSLAYGRRYFAICPEHFLIKVPLTPAGLLAARLLRADGIPVNLTLGFSARQNLLATAMSSPNYVNVFLGRLNAYAADNRLGDGVNVGEKATLASQRAIRTRTASRLVPTLQIAASLRSGKQAIALAGVDVHTMPVAAAIEALALGSELEDQTRSDLPVTLSPDPAAAVLNDLWTIGEAELALADSFEQTPPASPDDLLARCATHGLGGLFPAFTAEESRHLQSDGKIPRHERWVGRCAAGTCTIDGLLSAAALASFAVDQEALDARIRRLL